MRRFCYKRDEAVEKDDLSSFTDKVQSNIIEGIPVPSNLFFGEAPRDLRHTRRLARLRRVVGGVLAVLLAIAAACFLWPNGGQIRNILIQIWLMATPTPWLRSHISPEDVEQTMNALVFVPLAACFVLVAPRLRIWVWWVLSALGAMSIELTQLLFLSARKFDITDAVFNTIGGIVGSLLGAAILRLLCRRWSKNS